jgi:TM2 domain-containing membrane protein YozV
MLESLEQGRSSMTIFKISCVVISFITLSTAQVNFFALRSELLQPLKNETIEMQGGESAKQKKSPGAAVLYSLLLPGMGELYAGSFDYGKYSLIAEGGLWLTYVSFRQYGSWLRDDARRFASVHSGAAIEGKNDQFFVDVGNFNDTYEYNDKKLIDRSPERLYDVNAGYYWKWDSDASRSEFRALRVSSERVLNNSKFIIGAVIVNHIFSAVNAARLVKQYNQQVNDELGSWWLESSLSNDGAKPDGIKLSLVRRF